MDLIKLFISFTQEWWKRNKRRKYSKECSSVMKEKKRLEEESSVLTSQIKSKSTDSMRLFMKAMSNGFRSEGLKETKRILSLSNRRVKIEKNKKAKFLQRKLKRKLWNLLRKKWSQMTKANKSKRKSRNCLMLTLIKLNQLRT